MQTYNLNFGDIQIAKNNNKYKKAEATEAFWDAWKTNKEELKKSYSVYRENGVFYVFDWSFGVATEEEIAAKKEGDLKELKDAVIELGREWLRPKFAARLEKDVLAAETENDVWFAAEPHVENMYAFADSVYGYIKG